MSAIYQILGLEGCTETQAMVLLILGNADQRTTVAINFLLSPRGATGLNSGGQAW